MKADPSASGPRVDRRRAVGFGLGLALGGAVAGRPVHAEGMMEALRKRVTGGNEAGEQGAEGAVVEEDGCQSMLCFQSDRTGLGEEGKEGALSFAVPKGYKKTEEGKWEDGAGGLVEVRMRSAESSGVKLKEPPKRAAGPMGEASVKLSVAQVGTKLAKEEGIENTGGRARLLQPDGVVVYSLGMKRNARKEIWDVVNYKDQTYLLICSAPVDKWNSYKETFSSVLSSISLDR
mmetsp:Transcript_39779/g.124965  ORF Transcript_39779/g.124965 Transcript_39779/m.124965 type:complete len:233 (+) Transcript_39779:127-825(+)